MAFSRVNFEKFEQIYEDPPYFKKQSNNYDPDGISGLSKERYLLFLTGAISRTPLPKMKPG